MTVPYKQVREERAVSGGGQNGRRTDEHGLAVSKHELDVGTRSPAVGTRCSAARAIEITLVLRRSSARVRKG